MRKNHLREFGVFNLLFGLHLHYLQETVVAQRLFPQTLSWGFLMEGEPTEGF